MIVPTVGRVVWFFEPVEQDPAKPMAALVVAVHSERLVNLVAFMPNADILRREYVMLVQAGDPKPVAGKTGLDCWAEWMPSQVAKNPAEQASPATLMERVAELERRIQAGDTGHVYGDAK